MDYIFALEEGKFDKYISLEGVIEILCCFSEYTTYYIANYLKYYKFHNITTAYYIDVDSAEVLPINNQQEILLSLFKDITESPLTVNTAREVPVDLAGRLGDLYFIREELNKLDIFYKFDNPDFTNHKIVDEIAYKKYEDEKILISRKLYELAVDSRIEVEENNLINIQAVPDLIGRFFYQFIIKFDKLFLMNVNDFKPEVNQFVATIDSEQKYFNLTIENEQQKNEVKVLMEQVKKLTTENDKLKTQLNEKHTCKPTENQGYLDPNNKFFSIEMKLCHDTWNELYKNGSNSHLAHGQLAGNYLKNYPDFIVNTKAIERIATITNPKHKLAGTTAKEDL